ncbi:hypothetical protein C6361_33930 [Plantactinospora sp. BC1]|nr:hypothetical protein C6361_33930 [Plantactinospora sp. BC1]AVT39583.1 hypothetical protein C6W10_27600 [Plantactinospora sp. BB1]
MGASAVVGRRSGLGKGHLMLRKLIGLAGVGALLALVLACGFGGGGDDDDGDDDDFARRAPVVLVD